MSVSSVLPMIVAGCIRGGPLAFVHAPLAPVGSQLYGAQPGALLPGVGGHHRAYQQRVAVGGAYRVDCRASGVDQSCNVPDFDALGALSDLVQAGSFQTRGSVWLGAGCDGGVVQLALGASQLRHLAPAGSAHEFWHDILFGKQRLCPVESRSKHGKWLLSVHGSSVQRERGEDSAGPRRGGIRPKENRRYPGLDPLPPDAVPPTDLRPCCGVLVSGGPYRYVLRLLVGHDPRPPLHHRYGHTAGARKRD